MDNRSASNARGAAEARNQGPQIGDVAIIACLPGPLAKFLHELTIRLAPAAPRTAAHLTLLPPQPPPMPLGELVQHLGQLATSEPAFSIRLGAAATFLPVSEVLYLELDHGGAAAHRLHERLIGIYRGGAPERFRYHPHVTLAYALPSGEVARLLPRFQEEWQRYPGPREVRLTSLTVVRLSAPLQWDEVGTVGLQGR